MSDATRQMTDPAVFDAVVYPHRSLGPRGFAIVMTVFCTGALLIGGAAYLMGAWPVVGFLGLDILAVWLFFKLNFRDAKRYEAIHLTRSTFTLTRVDPAGHAAETTLPSQWLRVSMEHVKRRTARLTASTHGRTVEIGWFLGPDEKQSLYDALRSALSGMRDGPVNRT